MKVIGKVVAVIGVLIAIAVGIIGISTWLDYE